MLVVALLAAEGAVSEAREAVDQSAWVSLGALMITSLAGILASIAAIIGARHAKEAKQHAASMATEVSQRVDQAVGIPNGHGSLMAQAAQLLQNQHDISQAHARDSAMMTERITRQDRKLDEIGRTIVRLDDKLDGHMAETTLYRATTDRKLDEVDSKLDTMALTGVDPPKAIEAPKPALKRPRVRKEQP